MILISKKTNIAIPVEKIIKYAVNGTSFKCYLSLHDKLLECLLGDYETETDAISAMEQILTSISISNSNKVIYVPVKQGKYI